ncbi:MAG: NAD+ synthase [Candidatus Hermodarchaeota archaeon]
MFNLPKLDIPQTCRIIELFLSTRLEEARLKGYVIGLSGGLDSATSAAILVRAIGADKVKAFFLPTTTTPEKDLDDVEELCEKLHIVMRQIDVQPLLDKFSQQIALTIDSRTPEWSNLKARFRQAIWYFFANQTNYLVCGNGNKSELMIGYYTKFGDGAADVLPLGDIYKTHVIELAMYLEIPEGIINKPPSAGLWKDQTDEEEIGMTYELLDKILFLLEQFRKPQEISEILKIPLEQVYKVKTLIYQSEHKRRGPIILKLGVRTPVHD